jgi:tripartite-type tricarboxylate transporter receptor subunit TctC
VRVPLIVLIPASRPERGFAAFVESARRSNAVRYASAGNGQITHLAAELTRLRADFPAEHVPYRGSAEAVVDLIADRVQMLLEGPQLALSHIQAGALRPLAVTDEARLRSLPDVPTLRELGVDVVAHGWQGLLAAPAVPDEAVSRMHAALRDALTGDDLRGRIEAQGMEARPSTSPAAFAAFIANERETWAGVVRGAGVTIN